MKITDQLVPASRAKTYDGTNPARYVTVHETANFSRGADAQAHADLQSRGGARQASWHIQVDDRQAIRSYPDTARCWHAGDGRGPGNLESVGVEICVNADGDYDLAVANAADVVRQLREQHDIPASRVVQHYYWSGKHCPAKMRDARGWAVFVAATTPMKELPMVTLSSPMEGRFTSGYNLNRYIAGLGYSPHAGVDVAPPRAGTMGTSVHAIESGTVIRTVRGRRPGQSASSGAVIHPGISGNGVKILGNSGRVWVEAHVTPSVKVGQRVSAGEEIGVTDVSGRTTGPHVHCSLVTHGRWTDPTPLLSRNGIKLGAKPRGGGGGTSSGSHAKRRYGKGDVARLQRRLNDMGYDAGPADDYYGRKTFEAVQAWQRGQMWPGLVDDGDWGPACLAHYNWTIVLQKHINRFTGPSATSTGKVKRLRVDGDYGQVTAQAVLDIRQANDAAGAGKPTGAAGPVFCRWLNRSVTGVGRTLHPHPQDR